MSRLSVRRPVVALAAALLAGLSGLVVASTAHAQIPPGSQATVYVGGPVADCPPTTPADFAPVVGAVVNGITLSGAGRCAPLAADAEGTYTLPGGTPLTFNSECANTNGVVTTNGAVEVPAGTIVNGVPVTQTTTVTSLNTPVTFPGGQTAILNQVIVTDTSVTRNAIVFTGGPTVGQVVCGAAAYPLTVSASGESAAPPANPSAAAGEGGPGGLLLVAGGLVVVALLAQALVVQRIRRNRGLATG